MIMTTNTFNPNWASPPGKTIDELAKEKNISNNSLANYLEIKPASLNELLFGNIPLTNELAEKLSLYLGATPKFWINREAQYRNLVTELRQVEEKKWLSKLPTAEMVKLGWISPKFSSESLLEYFKVSNIWAWKTKYYSKFLNTAFRTSSSFDINFMSVSSWLRQGEIHAEKIVCAPFNSDLFQNKLADIKKLTKKKNPKNFIVQLKKICADCGVAIAFVKTPKGCTASGAAYFISKDKALIILSFRYLKDDQFWFTFFHEAGHILLHNKGVFIEELNHDDLDNIQEKEANNFAMNILIPEQSRKHLEDIPLTKDGIIRFALNHDISPGILIGQLQHLRIIGFNQLNWYKRSYKWLEIADILEN